MIELNELQIQARLAAIEYLLTKLIAAMLHNVSDENFETLLRNFRAGLEHETMPSSDLATSELRDEVLRLLNDVKEIRTMDR